MVRVPVSPEVLRWAQRVSGRDARDLESKFKRWGEWLRGDVRPTLNQLEELANYTHVPLGRLLLSAPREEPLPIPDFRAGRAGDVVAVDRNLLDLVYTCQHRQDWYRDYALRIGIDPHQFVGTATARTPVAETAAQIRSLLRFEVTDRATLHQRHDVRRHLLGGFEDLGGLTVATSMVGNDTHRLLDPDLFRGFTLADDLAPLICINTADTFNGQVFSILHEVAHVWRGASGVSDETPDQEVGSELELWCNAVAGEVLVPATDLAQRLIPPADGGWREELDRLADIYRCGTLVVLLRLRDTGLATFADFDAVFEDELARLAVLAEQGSTTAGGQFYLSQPYRIGRRLSQAVVADTSEGGTTVAEAMRLMSLRSLSTFEEYSRRVTAG